MHERYNQLVIKLKCLIDLNRMREAEALPGYVEELALQLFTHGAKQLNDVKELAHRIKA